ncbi:hypothetical protein E3N88_13936 [Mikania micrantha]|uniref:Uncharacterized protein n=1 Tax=Mikania micrantha TaxID=192012 RepID=A0A5N6P2M7_9ASTR|nr:hypothetical protein E3N88_13936 [Mikania micrantha]
MVDPNQASNMLESTGVFVDSIDTSRTLHVYTNSNIVDTDTQAYPSGYVAFAGDKGGFITREGILSNGQVSFDKLRYVKQLENNLLSVSQICDKQYKVLFDDSSCYILKQGVTIPEDWILMSAPRKQDLYVLNMATASTTSSSASCFMTKQSHKLKKLDDTLKLYYQVSS